MKPLLLSGVLMLLATPALADACDTLIAQAQGQMSSPSTTPAQKSQLEALLQAGRAAKAAGNVLACQNALQSQRPFRDPSKGRDCEETPDTV
jgi:hypothetical protein